MSDFTPPEYFFSSILTYIYSTSKLEFEELTDDTVIHIPLEEGNYTITKANLLEKVKAEIEQYGEQ